jgi:tricorn protease
MKKLVVLMALCLGLINAKGAQEPAYFLSDPTLSPDGNRIVFVYETDLWEVPSSGGIAKRLTAMDGVESNPRFSPDGMWLAFSSTQNGNADVYVMPLNGGTIAQLTHHDANDLVDSWSWDSKTIYFSSDRYNSFSAYKVNLNGGSVARLFTDNFFSQPHHVVEKPGDQAYYFTVSWESFLFSHRKRYVGDNSPNIEYYNLKTGEHQQLTTYQGKDMWPTVDRNGNVYIVSDEANKEYNLYRLTGTEKKQLTSFPTSIGRPQVSADGSKVVFRLDYQIYTYDVASGKSEKCDIKIAKTQKLLTDITYKTAEKITNFDVTPDGKKIAFVSRGRLFVSDIEGKFVREMATHRLERVLEVKWMDDNVSLLYTRTHKGYPNLFSIRADKGSAEKQLTTVEGNEYNIELSPKRDKAVYVSGNKHINVIDLKTNVVTNVVTDEFWFRTSQPRFSPDGKYIVYTAYRNFEPDVFICELATKKITNLTNSGTPESDPFWAPDGRSIYVSANRFAPGYPRGVDAKLYRIPLFRYNTGFRSDEYDNLFAKTPKKDSVVVDIRFDLEDVIERWEQLRVNSNNQSDPMVFSEKSKTLVLFNSSQNRENAMMKMEIVPFDVPKTEKLHDKAFDMLIKAGSKYYALVSGDVYEVKTADNKLDKLKLNHTFSKNLNDEFVQMFYENWSILAEHFYDKDYHGVNWKKIRDRYEVFVPHIRNRDNLNTLQNDMLGELNASHLGFRSTGDEEKTFYKLQSNATGIIFENDNPYTVKRIVKSSPADVLDSQLKPGDVLTSVNGIMVNAKANRESYFALPQLERELILNFDRKGQQIVVKLNPVSSAQLRNLMYDEWIASNQKRVDIASGKKVAYVHMKDMGDESLNQFLIEMTTEAPQREALILDLRNNRGGNVHNDVINFLSQRPYLEWQYRDGKRSPQPNFAPSAKPIVLLINEQSLSDAEMTTAAFKELKMGTIVGTETYRWIIFTSGKGLVDGSFTRLPAWGCYDLKGNNLEMTGVKPDIYVKNTFGDIQSGNDPQLDKALEIVLKQLMK